MWVQIGLSVILKPLVSIHGRSMWQTIRPWFRQYQFVTGELHVGKHNEGHTLLLAWFCVCPVMMRKFKSTTAQTTLLL
jgi:hypothetical protein